MPHNDGTGPNGQGPKTGRGMGKCGIIEKLEEGDDVIENEISPKNTEICRSQGLQKGRKCCGR